MNCKKSMYVIDLTDLSLHMALAFSIVRVAVLFKSVSRIVTNSPDPVKEKITEYIDLGDRSVYKQQLIIKLKLLQNKTSKKIVGKVTKGEGARETVYQFHPSRAKKPAKFWRE
jgi:hypothetical protein